jgi:hypothetical protein
MTTQPITNAEILVNGKRTLPNGHPIKFRPEQAIVWSIVLGFLFAGFAAGLYFGITQVNWHLFWLKPDWDGLFKYPWWETYRHVAFRDIPEPAFATLGVYTILAKPKYWVEKVATWRLALTPLAIIILIFALGVAGTWLLYFAPWTHNHDFSTVVAWHSAGNLVLGFVIGHFMRYLWQPVGATIQGRILEGRADKAANLHHVPLWVRFPVAPPAIRERFTGLYEKSLKVTGNLYDSNPWRAVMIGAMVLVFVVITALGLLGHYWVGTGHMLSWLPTTR